MGTHGMHHLPRTVKAITYQDKRLGSNNLLDTEPHSDDVQSFANQSWDETVMDVKKTGSRHKLEKSTPTKTVSEIY